MVDFGKLADDAKAKHDAIAADNAKLAKQDRAERAALVDRSVAVLTDHVAPLVEKAKREFSARGVESKIVTEYEVKGFASRKPTLKFSCLSPPRPSDKYKFESDIAVFSSDGESLFVSFEKGNSLAASIEKKQPDQTPIAASEAAVVAAIGAVVNHYYEMMRGR